MNYRKEIDGLRAIAVSAVILFHAGFSGFKGGFVGVDIFFVISGFLITSIILQDLETKSFSFLNFYARRASRILPILYITVLSSIPLAYLYLLPRDSKEFFTSLIYVPCFISNIFFMRESNYFDTDIALKPLIHTWSLAVEEQYYLIFPVLLFLLFKINRKFVLPSLIGIGLLSFLLTTTHFYTETRSFYLLTTRAWEILIGACAAIYSFRFKNHTNDNIVLTNLLGLMGLALITYAIVLTPESSAWPSPLTLLPTIGTALILISPHENNIVNKIIGIRPLVGMGLISYSAYMWHQPIFAFVKYRSMTEPSGSLLLFLIFSILVLAYLSWKYIERPFRLAANNNKKLIFLLLLPTLLIISLGFYGKKHNGFPERYPNLREEELIQEVCQSVDGVCKFSNTANDEPSFAVLGDSHALALIPAFKKILDTKNKSFVFSASGGCPPILNAYQVDQASSDSCLKTNENRFNYIKVHPSINKIFLIGRWIRYTDGSYVGRDFEYLGRSPKDSISKANSREAFEKGLRETIIAYQKLGAKVYIVYQVPEQLVHAGQFYFQLQSKNLSDEEKNETIARISVQRTKHLKLQQYNRSIFERLATEFDIALINLDDVFCKNTTCLFGNSATGFYIDKNHLSNAGALETVPTLLDALEN